MTVNFDLINFMDLQTASLNVYVGDLDPSDKSNKDSGSDSDSSSDKNDIPLFYHSPTFTCSKSSHTHSIVPYEKNPGPVSKFDENMSALEFFQIFYINEIFSDIIRFTNLNVVRKRTNDPVGNKGVWIEVSGDEMKAFYDGYHSL